MQKAEFYDAHHANHGLKWAFNNDHSLTDANVHI